jgi:hypothetical protein
VHRAAEAASEIGGESTNGLPVGAIMGLNLGCLWQEAKMPTFQRFVRDAERRGADLQRMLNNSGVPGLIRSMEQHAAIAQGANDFKAGIQASIERTRRFAEICFELKWPPPWHMPATVLDRVTVAYDTGKLTEDETAEIFSSFYSAERIDEFGRRWASYEWISDRIAILQEALVNHTAGRHYSAVCVLLPQIEGVLRDVLGTKPTQTNIVGVIRGYQLATAASKFYAEVLLEHFDPASTSPIPDLSRHAILHGKAVDYGTPIHSLKVILIADIILSSVEETRKQKGEGRPAADEKL